ncbi:MAG: molybdopterin-dependent oxidoreductase [Thermoanaerobaculia bacterium]|nr:molybdopterin-dependent oxidoreductase [Thermoanaerobaculia bacterium]
MTEHTVNENLDRLERRLSAAKAEVEARGETFYPGASRIHLASFPPKEHWDDWIELDSTSWPNRTEKRYMLVPTTCFNCESACGLLAYVDKESMQVRKFEGNPEHPGSRGRNCAKGPATHNQIVDPDRILYPLKRAGARGEGRWRRVSWDEALDDIAARIRKALQDGRNNEIMYHVGRPGEDGFTERLLAQWGVDGHNSHTNICSSAARAGYQFWCGMDRPSPDYARARVIFLVSSHLETGHYFNPHAQRIMEAKKNGAKLIVLDTRLSNTATHADHWLAPQPGSEAAIHLSIASFLIRERKYDRAFVRRWFNWQQYLQEVHPGLDVEFENFEKMLEAEYERYTFEFAATESGVSADKLRQVAQVVATAGSRFAAHNWRSAAAGNEGGWQVSRTLFFLSALLGAVAVPGGTYPSSWNKFVPKPIRLPRHPDSWNQLSWPDEFPLSMYEMSILLPHLVAEGRGKLDVYFTRVYNPVWTNPDGFSWIEMLLDEDKVGQHVALTPTWNESAFFADYVLPMGHSSERHDLHSYETHDGQWIGFRQPVLRTARERIGEDVTDTRDVNPGEVWEENEFWLELSWRIDPDGSLGIREWVESSHRPGERLTVDEFYGWIFDHSVPGLPEVAEGEGLTPLAYMRRYGAFQVTTDVGPLFLAEVPESELEDAVTDDLGRVFARGTPPEKVNFAPTGAPPGDAEGRHLAGVRIETDNGEKVLRGFPTPSGKLEFFSPTLARWGWNDVAVPTYMRSHVHPEVLGDRKVLISTFRIPVQIHTRSANAKWLDEIAHSNPLWIHPQDAEPLDARTGDLLRVETEIGHFVVKAWVTEGIRPGTVACSHHMGRWKPAGGDEHQSGQRQAMATVDLHRGQSSDGSKWHLDRLKPGGPYTSSDPDTSRIWWTDVGVHQNLTFPVHPDPVSGMHCWHQAVRVTRARPGDRYGDVHVDTAKSKQAFRDWMAKTRAAARVSPDGTRRPKWLIRPLKPTDEAYELPETAEA